TTVASGGSFSADISLAEGVHHIRAFQTDVAGNVSSVSAGLDVTVDTTAPDAPTGLDLDAADDSGVSTDNITSQTSGLTISGAAETDATVSLFDDVNDNGVMDGGESVITTTVASGGSFSTDISLAEGLHHIRAFQTDVAGNVSTASAALDITVDTPVAAPTDLDLAAADDTNVDTDNVTSQTSDLTISGVAETGATVSLFDDANNNGLMDGGESVITTAVASGGSFSADISLAEGLHHIRAIQTDIAANVSTASVALDITVDTQSPAVPGLDLAAADDSGINTDNITNVTSGLTISGAAEDGATVSLFLDTNDNGVLDGGESILTTAVASGGSYSTDISLGEGLHHLRAFQTDVAGNVGTGTTVLDITVDTTVAAPTVAMEVVIDANDATNGVSLTVAGLDPDATAVVTLTDSIGNTVTFNVPMGGNGVYNAVLDLSGLVDGKITPSIVATDIAANSSAPTLGAAGVLARGSDLTFSVAQYLAADPSEYAGFDPVTVSSSSSSFAPLTTNQIEEMATNGVDFLGSPSGSLFVTAAVYAGAVASSLSFVGSNIVTLRDTAAAIEALSPAQLAELVNEGVDAVRSDDVGLHLTVDQYRAIGSVPMLPSKSVTLEDTAAALGTLTVSEIGGLAASQVITLAVTSGTFELSVTEYQALGAVNVTGVGVTLADTGSTLAALNANTLAGLAAKGIDILDSTTDALTLTPAKFSALSVSLTGADTVTIKGTTAELLALNLGALAGAGVDILNSTDNVVTLTAAQAAALGTVRFVDGDAVTIADTASNIEALGVSDFAGFASKGIDIIDASGALTLSAEEFAALGKVQINTADGLTVVGAGADDEFTFKDQVLDGNTAVAGNGGFDTLSLNGDYSSGVDIHASVERVKVADGFSYDLTADDANLGVGQNMSIIATSLGATRTITFDGSAESDGGTFEFKGGTGTNDFTGGDGGDKVVANATGTDIVHYTAASQSTSTSYDTVVGFNGTNDRFDLDTAVTLAPAINGGTLNAATFDADLATAMAGLANDTAVLFKANVGDLKNIDFMVINIDGNVGYDAGQDLVVRLNSHSNISDSSFV
ncbi:MAG: hypothetical protein KIS73_20095, partial [Enhydrobacter sp.]|nr:hypothetical protein [Enhydrobacter sp.]